MQGNIKVILQLKALLLLVALINACGFHLRGSGGAEVSNLTILSPLVINGGETDVLLRNQLSRALKEAGVTLSEQAEGSNVLTLNDVTRDRRVLTVGADGKISEYELYYAVTFSINDAKGESLVPSQSINVVRNYAFNEQELLAKSAEQARLYDDMRFDMVRMIMRRVQAQTKK